MCIRNCESFIKIRQKIKVIYDKEIPADKYVCETHRRIRYNNENIQLTYP